MGAGKAGANFVDAFVGRAVEHIKDDPKEGGFIYINIISTVLIFFL